ncbi:MAG: hypothetical protein WAX77_04550 [Methylococcaceae bacterium]
MSTEENTEQVVNSSTEETVSSASTADSTPNKVGGIVASLLSLKEKNPKVFFGGLGGVVVLLIVAMSSGGGNTVSGPTMKNLVVGQHYTLKSANAYDANSTIRLVSVPGTIAAYDDTEEADRNGACQHMPQGTSVTVLDLSDAYGKKNTYAKVRVEDGSCKNTEAWTLSIDVQ